MISKAAMTPMLALVLAATAASVGASNASAAEVPTNVANAATELRGTPFESPGNAAALEQLMRVPGVAVRRSSLDGTLNADDWMRLHALGFEHVHSAAVVLHYVPKTDPARQVARLRMLARSVDAFGPSGACDRITREGDGMALCTGSFDGPLGKVPVRMSVASALRQEEGGAIHLLLRNARALEAKPFLSWGRIVEPDRLKVAVDLFPTTEGWFVYTRVAVAMSAHESSAKTISDTLLKLDSWLCRDLSRT